MFHLHPLHNYSPLCVDLSRHCNIDLEVNMKTNCFTSAVPPSKPYFTTDVTTPWVAGKKYKVECVAPDAKPEADITLYKGESLSSFPADFSLTAA